MTRVGGENTRIVHVNNTKLFTEWSACASTLVAKEDNEMAKWEDRETLSAEKCQEYNEGELCRVLAGLSQYYSVVPGVCSVDECVIDVEKSSKVVKIPPRSFPVHIREQVKAEVEKMLKAGVIERSDSEWSSPVVPIRKKDGSIIAYRFP